MNDTVRIVKDFPKKGINFYDISSILAKPQEFKKSLDKMISITKKMKPTAIAGIDSRGFLFASIVAYSLKLKLIIIRKKGKLPGRTYRNSYKLEYGNNTLEIQRDFLNYKDRVVVIDDIFATSGTMNASCKLVEKTKAKVLGTIVLIELNFLKGRSKIKYNLESLIKVNT